MKSALHSEKFAVIEIPLDEIKSLPTLGIRYQEGTGMTFRLKMEMDGFRYYTATDGKTTKVLVDCYLPGNNGQWKTVHEYSPEPFETEEPTAPWEEGEDE